MTELMETAAHKVQRLATKEITRRGSTYDWRAAIGVVMLGSAYVLSRVNDLPVEWAPWVKKADVLVGLLGLVLAVQGRPLIAPPAPKDAIDERGDA